MPLLCRNNHYPVVGYTVVVDFILNHSIALKKCQVFCEMCMIVHKVCHKHV